MSRDGRIIEFGTQQKVVYLWQAGEEGDVGFPQFLSSCCRVMDARVVWQALQVTRLLASRLRDMKTRKALVPESEAEAFQKFCRKAGSVHMIGLTDAIDIAQDLGKYAEGAEDIDHREVWQGCQCGQEADFGAFKAFLHSLDGYLAAYVGLGPFTTVGVMNQLDCCFKCFLGTPYDLPI